MKFLIMALLSIGMASAAPVTMMIGDNDGFGLGVPDNGIAIWPGPEFSGTAYDGRSTTESGDQSGAQFTDTYSALYPGWGPDASTMGTVVFALPSRLSAATLEVDMGDFQASTFGQLLVSFNGVSQPNLFNFEDGFQRSQIRTFALNETALAAANAAGALYVTIDRGSSADFVAFDYFKLSGEAVPEPTTYALLGSGLFLIGLIRRRLPTRR